MSDFGEQNNSKKSNLKDRKTIIGLFENYSDDIYSLDDKERELQIKVIEKEEAFTNTLTEQQKEQYEKVWELKNERNGRTDEKIFVYGFSLATKLILEGVQLDTTIF